MPAPPVPLGAVPVFVRSPGPVGASGGRFRPRNWGSQASGGVLFRLITRRSQVQILPPLPQSSTNKRLSGARFSVPVSVRGSAALLRGFRELARSLVPRLEQAVESP